jgi:uncharacterized DUF497 family protein
MKYEWDPTKASINRRIHRVSFEEAATIFLDPLAMTFEDPDHSNDEQRFVTIGWSSRHRVLFVSHADRGTDRIRIISARKATRRERNDYKETNG